MREGNTVYGPCKQEILSRNGMKMQKSCLFFLRQKYWFCIKVVAAGDADDCDHPADDDWTATGIKGTMWTTSPIGPKTDPTVTDPVAQGPACELPKADYTTPYVIAVGWADSLGPLKMSADPNDKTAVGKCGQVYEIQCDGSDETVKAIVISSGTNGDGSGMGIDMQEPTYEAATKTTYGTTLCKARLSTENPIKGKEYQCFHRYDGAPPNDWYASIALFNTNG